MSFLSKSVFRLSTPIRATSTPLARDFSSTAFPLSHIGSAPIYLAPDVTCSLEKVGLPRVVIKGKTRINLSQNIKIKGPKGELDFIVPDFVNVDRSVADKLQVSVNDIKDRIQRLMWGTVASILNNNITGVTEGHLAILKLVGTGYRATVLEDKETGKQFVSMKVGASIMQGLTVPDGITVSSPVPTRVVIEGINKQQVKLFAANLRKFHPPEPYKGKGIYIDDETIKIKDKKIK